MCSDVIYDSKNVIVCVLQGCSLRPQTAGHHLPHATTGIAGETISVFRNVGVGVWSASGVSYLGVSMLCVMCLSFDHLYGTIRTHVVFARTSRDRFLNSCVNFEGQHFLPIYFS